MNWTTCIFTHAHTHLLPVKPLAHWHCPVSGSHLPLLWQTHSSAQFGPYRPSGHRSVQTSPCRKKKTTKRQKERYQMNVGALLQKTEWDTTSLCSYSENNLLVCSLVGSQSLACLPKNRETSWWFFHISGKTMNLDVSRDDRLPSKCLKK